MTYVIASDVFAVDIKARSIIRRGQPILGDDLFKNQHRAQQIMKAVNANSGDQMGPANLYAHLPDTGIYVGPGSSIEVHVDRRNANEAFPIEFKLKSVSGSHTASSREIETAFAIPPQTRSERWLWIAEYDPLTGRPGQRHDIKVTKEAASAGVWIKEVIIDGQSVPVHIVGRVDEAAYENYKTKAKLDLPPVEYGAVDFWIEWDKVDLDATSTSQTQETRFSQPRTDDSSIPPTTVG